MLNSYINSSRQIIKTTDGGNSWEQQLQDSIYLRCIGFANPLQGWAGTLTVGKRLYSTTDGGQNWKLIDSILPEFAPSAILGFVDENQGWVGGWGDTDFEGGFSSETKDGGKNWQDVNQIGQFINRFRFFGNPVTVGYASGKTVYKYSAAPVIAPLMERIAPLRFLTTNVPAQFEKSVKIEYTLSENVKKVTINIWNQFGAYVRKLVDESHPSAGQKSVVWDGKNDAEESLPPGIFIYRLTVDGKAESRVIRLNA